MLVFWDVCLFFLKIPILISWWVVDCQWPNWPFFKTWIVGLLAWFTTMSLYQPIAGFQLQDPGDGSPFWLDATRHLKGGTHAELVILKGFWVNWDSLNWSPNLTFGLGCLYLGDEVSVFFLWKFHGWPYKWKLHTYSGSPLGADGQGAQKPRSGSRLCFVTIVRFMNTHQPRLEEEHCLVHRNGYFQK